VQIVVSADDFGLSDGITMNILDAVDNGLVTSVSIIANGIGFDRAIREYQSRSRLHLAVHLNLMEGRSLLPGPELPDLVDGRGMFRQSFQSLCLLYLRSDDARRASLREQVRAEFRAQLERVTSCVGSRNGLRVDSHLHVHMIPFVFDELLELHDEFELAYVRCLAESFFLAIDGFDSLRNYAGSNIVKHALLRTLARRARTRLQSRGISHCRHFVGVLFSGNMRERAVSAALARLADRCGKDEIVEILFHPGGAAPLEASLWNGKPAFRSVYYSDWRSRERETLKSPTFRALIESQAGRREGAVELP
jgi:predicted glycoside hydrolase/deacetylase ChbG (UPF0249 family)